jgi:hypothetical protein
MISNAPKWIIGAYSASPTRFDWVPAEEEDYLSGIYAIPTIRGLEVPFTGTLHKFDEPWFLARIPKHLDIVLTLIPATTAAVKNNPNFGIASSDEEGRKCAVALAKDAADAVNRIEKALGRKAVIAVQLHSAPGGKNVDALAKSLIEISEFSWQGAKLVLEHCDAKIPDQKAEKGYLSLSDEIAAIKLSNKNIGITINWGRSAIESRSAQGPLEHLKQAEQAGLLAGLMFSGASDVDNRFGTAWKDCHVPPAPLDTPAVNSQELLEPKSLMTADEMRKCYVASQPESFQGYYGLKIAPLHEVTIEERIATVTQSISVLERSISKAQ